MPTGASGARRSRRSSRSCSSPRFLVILLAHGNAEIDEETGPSAWPSHHPGVRRLRRLHGLLTLSCPGAVVRPRLWGPQAPSGHPTARLGLRLGADRVGDVGLDDRDLRDGRRRGRVLRVRSIWVNVPALVLTFAVGMACFSALGLAVAAIAPTPSAAQAFSNASLILLAFISGVAGIAELRRRWTGWSTSSRSALRRPGRRRVPVLHERPRTPGWFNLAVIEMWEYIDEGLRPRASFQCGPDRAGHRRAACSAEVADADAVGLRRHSARSSRWTSTEYRARVGVDHAGRRRAGWASAWRAYRSR